MISRSGDSTEMNYNVHMAKLLDGGRNKLAARPGSLESLQQLVEVARNLAANPATLLLFLLGRIIPDKLQSRRPLVSVQQAWKIIT
ncbi:unnamed protein product [Camellia sinensis]